MFEQRHKNPVTDCLKYMYTVIHSFIHLFSWSQWVWLPGTDPVITMIIITKVIMPKIMNMVMQLPVMMTHMSTMLVPIMQRTILQAIMPIMPLMLMTPSML